MGNLIIDSLTAAYDLSIPDYRGYNIVRGRLIPKPSLARQIVTSSEQIMLDWDNSYGKGIVDQGNCFTVDMDENYFWNGGEPCDFIYQYHKGFLAIKKEYYYKCKKDYHDYSLIARYHKMNEADVLAIADMVSVACDIANDEEVSSLVQLALDIVDLVSEKVG